MTTCFGQNNTALINIVQRGGSYSGILLQDRQLLLCNTLVSNHVNSDHVPSFSCVDVWNVRQMTSGVMLLLWQRQHIIVVDAVDYK